MTRINLDLTIISNSDKAMGKEYIIKNQNIRKYDLNETHSGLKTHARIQKKFFLGRTGGGGGGGKGSLESCQ